MSRQKARVNSSKKVYEVSSKDYMQRPSRAITSPRHDSTVMTPPQGPPPNSDLLFSLRTEKPGCFFTPSTVTHCLAFPCLLASSSFMFIRQKGSPFPISGGRFRTSRRQTRKKKDRNEDTNETI